MKYDGVLMSAYECADKMYQMGDDLPKGMYFCYGYWDFENYMTYSNDKMYVKVNYSREFLNFNPWSITICIDQIIVYKDRWVHDVPEEMKKYIYIRLEELNQSFVIVNNGRQLNKRYKKYQKDKEARKEMKKQQEHKEEQDRLFKMFKQ